MAGLKLPNELAGKRIAVLGAATEGAATARWLVSHGVIPTVCDRASHADLGGTYQELTELGVTEWRLGDGYLDLLTDFDVVFRTPQLPTSDPKLEAARQAGVTVTSHTKLFFSLCPAPIIGVTGTKGKGTTAGLIHTMLEADGRRSFLGGNIGTPPLQFLDELTSNDTVVLELSSFQLEDLEQSPHIAVVTNLTADHLDRHESVAEYRAAKRSIVTFQGADDRAILNQDDTGAKQIAEYAGGPVAWFSIKRPVSDGAFVKGDDLYLKLGEDEGPVCGVSELLVPGPHNRANALAACAATAALGVSRESMRKAIQEYRGLPYHLEFIGEHNGVKFYNDSYATNPTATIPAIESFEQPVVLVLGGEGKGLEYDELATTILQRDIRGIVTMSPEGEKIEAALINLARKIGKPVPTIEPVTQKEGIVPAAVTLAQSGDVVVFSPAATSFNWFESYTDRGRFFTETVAKL